jgi:predicted Zn-dependent protease
MRLAPENSLYWYAASLAAVRAGDLDGYRQHSRELLQAHRRFEVPEDAYWLVSSLVLHPQSTDDWGAVIDQASPVLTQSNAESHWMIALAAALCQAGRYPEATNLLQAVVEKGSENGSGRLWLALALWKQGVHELARQELKKAERELAISHIDAPWYLREGETLLVREIRSELKVEFLPNGERHEW